MDIKGAYEILRTGNNISVTILSTGSETSLASEVGHKLATDGIYSKIISMPCHELFDQQSEGYKNEILSETNLVVSIEASETSYWKKYTNYDGLNFGIDDFGKSANSASLILHVEVAREHGGRSYEKIPFTFDSLTSPITVTGTDEIASITLSLMN